jgi:hypothetical protein
MVEYIKELYDKRKKIKIEPDVCKNCIVKSCCKRDYIAGSMCDEALQEYVNMMYDNHKAYLEKEKEKNGDINKESDN